MNKKTPQNKVIPDTILPSCRNEHKNNSSHFSQRLPHKTLTTAHTILYKTHHYLIEVIENTLFLSLVTAVFWAAFFCSSSVKHFQIRSVSSAPADTTVWQSGDIAICNTRAVWPRKQNHTINLYENWSNET